ETISRQNVVLGTVAYMSPEQARGRAVDVHTDIWAFGCSLYEMLTGTPAFQGETPTDIVIKIATEEPDWSRLSMHGTASSELQRITRKCMQKAPTFRYHSVRELTADLDAVLRELANPQPAPASGAQQSDAVFVLPGKFARPLFMMVQFGYLSLYTAAMYHIES